MWPETLAGGVICWGVPTGCGGRRAFAECPPVISEVWGRRAHFCVWYAAGMLRDLPVSTTELEPGEYFLSLAAPDAVLNAFLTHSDWARRATAWLITRQMSGTMFVGGGPAWITPPGAVRVERVLQVQLRVGDPPGSGGRVALVSPVVVAVAAAVAAVAFAIGINVALAQLRRLEQVVPDTVQDAGRGFLALAQAARLAALAAVGLVGVSLLRRLGVGRSGAG